jgi:hypothetical protein
VSAVVSAGNAAVAELPAAAASTDAAAPPRKRGRPKGSVNGDGSSVAKATRKNLPAGDVVASAAAKRTAAVLLEVLGGLRSSTAAARELGVAPVRFYAIEARAVAGLVAACEPRPAGVSPERRDARELAQLRTLSQRQTQELNQLRSVLRTTQRQLGVANAAAAAKSDGKRPKSARVRRPVVRALTVVRRLMRAAADAPLNAAPATPPVISTAEPGGG